MITTYEDAPVTARNNKKFTNSREAKFSISGGVAAALLRGRVDKNTFSEDAIKNPKLLELVDKTEIFIDDEMTRNYPSQWAAAVEVQTSRGIFRAEEKEPWGNLKDAIPTEKLWIKYTQLVEDSLTEQRAENLWERCMHLENLADVRELFAGMKV